MLDVPAEHLDLVRRLLRQNLPAGASVRAFGSRVGGRVKPYSDLDLAIDAGRRLSLDEHAALAEAFSESDLPWKVDLIDRHAVTETFWQRIESTSVELSF